MWIMLTLFISLSSWAIAPGERINNVNILKVLPDNIVMLNRGLEDGLTRNQHVMLVTEAEGFTARAICVRSRANVSYWRLYRIPYAEAVSLDYTYTIVGIDDREIPSTISSIRSKQVKIPEEEKKKNLGPDPFQIQRDLPERLTERDLIQASGPEERKLFIEQTLNQDQLKRDLSDYRVSLYASPFTRQSINEGESLRYGIRAGNVASKYRLLMQFEQQQSKMKDPFTEESVSTRTSVGQGQFVIHRIKPWLSSLSVVNYNSTYFSGMGTPRSQWQFGPIGFTWHLYESDTWEYLDLSYVPLYDSRDTDVFSVEGKKVESRSGIRHGFRFAMKTRINERVAFENLLWVRPYQDPTSWEIQGDDLNLVNDLKIIFNVAGNLFIDYNLVYQKDKLWKELNGLPESNTINSINFRYDFDL